MNEQIQEEEEEEEKEEQEYSPHKTLLRSPCTSPFDHLNSIERTLKLDRTDKLFSFVPKVSCCTYEHPLSVLFSFSTISTFPFTFCR